MQDLPLELLRTFVATVDTGSMAKAARVVARDRTPLSVVHGRDPDALRSAILGQPFRGTLVVD